MPHLLLVFILPKPKEPKGSVANMFANISGSRRKNMKMFFPIILHFLLAKAMNILFGYEGNNECLIVYDWIFFFALPNAKSC